MSSLAVACLLTFASPPQEPGSVTAAPASLQPSAGRVEQPVELGQVRWRRDFDAARAEAKQADKPVLILFQEVPG